MPIIEEIEDEEIDNMDYDPSQFDSHNPFDKDMPVAGVQLRPTQQTPQANTVARAGSSQPQAPLPFKGPDGDDVDLQSLRKAMEEGGSSRELPEHMKQWKVLYPLYFDANRSVAKGRRVPASLAVKNPLCTRIIEAAQHLGLEAALEVTKGHPKDWANPGRVRINTSKPKRHLYKELCEYLQKNPTTERNASVQMYKQFASFDTIKPLAVPKGMVINDILPGISPALSAQKTIEQSMNMGDMGKMFGM